MNDIQYFAKIKDSPEPAKPISWFAGKPSSVPVKAVSYTHLTLPTKRIV